MALKHKRVFSQYEIRVMGQSHVYLKSIYSFKCLIRFHFLTESVYIWHASGSAVAQWYSALLETEGPRVRASPASLRCGPGARHIYPILVLVQPRKTRPCFIERVLMGRKESNQTNKKYLAYLLPMMCRLYQRSRNIYMTFGSKVKFKHS